MAKQAVSAQSQVEATGLTRFPVNCTWVDRDGKEYPASVLPFPAEKWKAKQEADRCRTVVDSRGVLTKAIVEEFGDEPHKTTTLVPVYELMVFLGKQRTGEVWNFVPDQREREFCTTGPRVPPMPYVRFDRQVN